MNLHFQGSENGKIFLPRRGGASGRRGHRQFWPYRMVFRHLLGFRVVAPNPRLSLLSVGCFERSFAGLLPDFNLVGQPNVCRHATADQSGLGWVHTWEARQASLFASHVAFSSNNLRERPIEALQKGMSAAPLCK